MAVHGDDEPVPSVGGKELLERSALAEVALRVASGAHSSIGTEAAEMEGWLADIFDAIDYEAFIPTTCKGKLDRGTFLGLFSPTGLAGLHFWVQTMFLGLFLHHGGQHVRIFPHRCTAHDQGVKALR